MERRTCLVLRYKNHEKVKGKLGEGFKCVLVKGRQLKYQFRVNVFKAVTVSKAQNDKIVLPLISQFQLLDSYKPRV